MFHLLAAKDFIPLFDYRQGGNEGRYLTKGPMFLLVVFSHNAWISGSINTLGSILVELTDARFFAGCRLADLQRR